MDFTAELQRGIQATEMRCYRKSLRISYKDHVTNEEVRAKIQHAFGPHEEFLTIVKRRKLKVYGHCLPFSSSGENHLARHGERGEKTRQTKMRWEDNTKKLTGPEFDKSQRAVENREKWRKLVRKSPVCPNDPRG